MKRLLGTLLILSAIGTPASASYLFSRTCYQGACYYSLTQRGSSAAKVIDVPPDATWTRAKDDEWVAFCKPEKHVDQWGVTRLTYAHDGCGFGRSR